MKTSTVSGGGSVIPEPTPAEIEAGASLVREPERLESVASEPPAPPVAVRRLVEQHPSSTQGGGAPHRGLSLAVGGGAAAGPGIAVGGEASLGVVVDFTEPKVSVFTSGAWGTAIAPGASVGVSGQAGLVRDVRRFWGSGAEHGINAQSFGASLNHATSAPGGPRELNGVTVSAGPGIGGDVHYFEGHTREGWSLSLDQVKGALHRLLALPGIRRFGL